MSEGESVKRYGLRDTNLRHEDRDKIQPPASPHVERHAEQRDRHQDAQEAEPAQSHGALQQQQRVMFPISIICIVYMSIVVDITYLRRCAPWGPPHLVQFKLIHVENCLVSHRSPETILEGSDWCKTAAPMPEIDDALCHIGSELSTKQRADCAV